MRGMRFSLSLYLSFQFSAQSRSLACSPLLLGQQQPHFAFVLCGGQTVFNSVKLPSFSVFYVFLFLFLRTHIIKGIIL
jgi:hypothetical protein